MKRKRWNAGFSLVDLLLAVAIIATLCGFGFVSVMQQRKNLKVMEAGETAKEIFLAAQEHLSMAATQGRLQPANNQDALLGLTIAGAEAGVEVKDENQNVVAYAVFDDKSVSAPNGGATAQTLSTTASDVMLPQGAVDAFVLNQRYAISYNAEAYRVLDVFYTEDNNYVFKHADGEPWTESKTWDDGKIEVRDNPGDFQVDKSQKAVIMGWYGEDALLYSADGAAAPPKPSVPNRINPGLDLVNGPVLFAVVALNMDYTYSDVTLNIADANGGSVSIPVTPFGTSPRVKEYKEENNVKYYIVILDDVTTPDFDFNHLFAEFPDSTPIEPGSNIQVTVEAKGQENGNPVNLEGYSETKECNSLFADTSNVFDENASEEDVRIKNFRHLQNLTNLNPGKDLLTGKKKPVDATLDNDIDWTSFRQTVVGVHNICGMTGDVAYQPVNIDYELDFNGNKKAIDNLEIKTPDSHYNNAGVFGTLKDDANTTISTTIRDLSLNNTTVSAGGATAAGALVGHSEQNLTVNNVESSSNGSIEALDYAGGLIGHAEKALDVTNARTHISGGSVKATSVNGVAGGLVGGASGTVSVTSSASYSQEQPRIENGIAYNVTPGAIQATGDNGVAGGLIGAIEGSTSQATVTGCAAANQVTASTDNGIAGGLIGRTDGTAAVSTSYVGGITTDNGKYDHSRVAGTDNTLNGNAQGAYAGGLIGRAGGTLTLDKAYSAASAYGSKDASGLYPTYGVGSVTKDNATVYGAGEYQQGTNAIKVGSPAYSGNAATVGQMPYDAELADAGANYPYMSLKDMGAGGNEEWIKNHVGDWPNIPDLTPTIVLNNAEVLSVDVWLDDCDYSYPI